MKIFTITLCHLIFARFPTLEILLLLKVLCGKDLRCESPGVFAPERSRPDDDDDDDDDDGGGGGGDHH